MFPAATFRERRNENTLENAKMKTLRMSSLKTRRWLNEVVGSLGAIDRANVKYYCKLGKPSFAMVLPQKKALQLFLTLPESFSPTLQQSLCTKGWHDYYPSKFCVRSRADFAEALRLLRAAAAFVAGGRAARNGTAGAPKPKLLVELVNDGVVTTLEAEEVRIVGA
jgi:hypothetical protein